MGQVRVLVIFPYAGLESTIKKVAESYPEMELRFLNPDSSASVKAALLSIHRKKAVDVVIARDVYRQDVADCGIAFVPFSLSFGDLYLGISACRSISGKRALLFYDLYGKKQLREYAETICSIERANMQFFDANTESETAEILQRLKSENYGVVIGGASTVHLAQSFFLNAVQIPYGVESIRNAFSSVRVLFNETERLKKEFSVYKTLLEEMPDFIAVQKNDGTIRYQNGGANSAQLLKLVELSNRIHPANDSATFELEQDGIVWVATKKTSSAVSDGFIWCFRRLRFVDFTYGGSITYINRPPSTPIANLYRSTNFAHIREQIETYKNAREPVLITGERGLGKGNIAFLLNNEQAMLRIDCNHLTLDSFRVFTNEGYQRISGTVSAILVASADEIVPELQEMMADFLSNIARQSQIRIISTAWDEIYRKVSRGSFSHRLYHLLSGYSIDVPPLRSAIGEMDQELAMMISVLNIELGLQIVGLQPDAMEALKAFDWGANLQQLTDVLRRSMLASTSPYLSGETVHRMLEVERSVWSSSRGAAAYWKGTLDDIEKRIIRGILEEEDMNQTKAAKRLGISRSTLWKKIK